MKSAIFSFFSGAGFLDLGFETSGFRTALVNEIHEPFMDAYRHSRKAIGLTEPTFGHDLSSIDTFLDGKKFKQIRSQFSELRSNSYRVGIIGGPPCPDFSVGGKNKGRTGDNGRLSQSYIDLICAVRPDFFLFENVKGLWRTVKHREFYESLKKQLQDAGYCCYERLTNAIEYGVAQDRDRIILVGFLRPSRNFELRPEDWETHMSYPGRIAFGFPWPSTNSPRSKAPKPDGIPYELTIHHWFERNSVGLHPNSSHYFQPRAGLARFKSTLEGDVSRKSYKRLHRWRYSPTAAYGNNEVHIHPYLSRRITVAEALAIQSLPPDYEFPEYLTLTDMFKAIGNGVPYLESTGLAKMMRQAIGRAYK